MEMAEVEELDAAGALCAFGDLRRERARAERDILVVAAHFADLYDVDSSGRQGTVLPGTERPIRVAGEGAPLVREFAVAEMALELATTCHAARSLIGDALELRHRLPRLWQRVVGCEVAVWLARRAAQATRGLSVEQAASVDAALAPIADGRVGVRVFLDNLEAAVVAADPDAAAERERAAATEEFAKVGQANTHGRKTLYVKTSAAQMTRIDATLAYLAEALRALGDREAEDRRRAKAILILANPVEALRLMQAFATDQARHDDPSDGSPGYGDSDEPLSDPTDDEPAGSPQGDGPVAGFLTRFRPADVPPCPCRGGTYLPAWDRLLPQVRLYIHLDGATHGHDCGVRIGASGVARWEGEGPISAQHVRDFLGPHARFVIVPVIDLARQAPSAGYEVRGRLREAVHLRNPLDVFPHASHTGRGQQIDHTDPYRHAPDGSGAGPPQTRMGNLGPMARFHHRVKTHATGWQVRQPFDGIYVWRTPHGSIYLVDHTGTRQVRRPTPGTSRTLASVDPGGPMLDVFWDLVTTAV